MKPGSLVHIRPTIGFVHGSRYGGKVGLIVSKSKILKNGFDVLIDGEIVWVFKKEMKVIK